MSKVTLSTSPINTNQAAFQAWGSALSGALATLGLVKTADTGQINWATVAAPTAVGQVMGYEIWRFADTLQAGCPVFIKIAYGSGTSALAPNVTANVGNGSDGAGNLLNAFNSMMASNSSTSNSSQFLSYLCGGNNRLCMALWPYLSNVGCIFCVERLKNADGTENANGVFCGTQWTTGGGQTTASGMLRPYPQLPGIKDQKMATICVPGSAQTNGGIVGLNPIWPVDGILFNPIISMLECRSGDVIDGSTVTVAMYGVNHNYLALSGSAIQNFDYAGTAASRIAMLWE